MHKPDAWDADDGVGGLDLDATNADFETLAVVIAPAPPIPASEPSVLHVMPMAIDSPKTSPAKALKQPEPIDQEMVEVPLVQADMFNMANKFRGMLQAIFKETVIV